MGFLNTIKNSLLDIVYPENCLSCNKSGVYLCEDCILSSPPALRPTLAWIYPMYDYRHLAIKKSITFLKYKGRRRIIDIFAKNMYGRIMEELVDLDLMENFKSPILMPVPLAPKRFKERGFNQSELLCRKLKMEDSGGAWELMTGVLIKPKDTIHQANIKDRGQRLRNLSGSFVVKEAELIKGRNIILIDDVVTTGATLGEARKTLKQSGARKVIAFTIAH